MSLRGQILAWSMALRSHARRVRAGAFDRDRLAADLQHLADEAVRVAQTIDPEPAAIPDDGPQLKPDEVDEDPLSLADTQPIYPMRPKAKA